MGFRSLLDGVAMKILINSPITIDKIMIPELAINVPVYWKKEGTNGQDIVDAPNSAVIFKWTKSCDLKVIADHSSQSNFRNLNRAKVNETEAYLDLDKRRIKHRCIVSEVGHIKTVNGRNFLFGEDWLSIYPKHHDGICIYTCIKRSAPDVMDVRLTFWKEV